MNKQLSRLSGGALLPALVSAMSPAAHALEINTNAMEEHPIRMMIGIVSLVLAIILILVMVVGSAYRTAKRNRSFGSEKTYGHRIDSGRKTSGSKRQYGRGLLGIFIPSYKGGKSSAGGGQLWASSSPKRHRNGRSAAGSANTRSELPLSYKEPWGSRKRYGLFHFGFFHLPYKGGKSSAGEGQLHTTSTPGSHSGSRRKQRGGWRPSLPTPSYKGGFSKAGEGNVPTPHTPGSHRGFRIFGLGGWKPDAPTDSYKGGFTPAGEAKGLNIPLPTVHKGRKSGTAGGWKPDAPNASYKGGFNKAGEGSVPTPHIPAVHRGFRLFGLGGWKPNAPTASYKGGFNKAGEGSVPTPHIPAIHRGFRLFSLGGWKPNAPTPSYKGGFTPAGDADLSVEAPSSHRGGRRNLGGWKPDLPSPSYKGGRRSAAGNANLARAFPNRYRSTVLGGLRPRRQPLVVPVDSYKGGFAAAKNANVRIHLPKRHRYRLYDPRLSGKTWTITQSHYVGGGSRVRPGQVIQELPLSYKEPWGSKRRYGAVEGGPLYIRMDGSPKPHGRVVQELPLSYKEPWGSKKRYGVITKSPLPIHMDGAPHPESKVIVELPMSYKEPWGDPKRYGPESPAKFCPPEKHYQGGSTTSAKGVWQNPETGEVFAEKLSDAQRYGNKRYGGKLYGVRSPKHYTGKKVSNN